MRELVLEEASVGRGSLGIDVGRSKGQLEEMLRCCRKTNSFDFLVKEEM